MVKSCVMRRSILLGIQLLVWLIVTPLIYANPIVVTQSITLDNHRVTLSEPIIQTDAGLYGPMRALADALGAQTTYTRRSRLHTIQTSDTIQLDLKAYSRAFWVNQRLQYTDTPPIQHHNQLYIPLAQFLPALGYTMTQTPSAIQIQKQSGERPAPTTTGFAPAFAFSKLADTPIQSLQFNGTHYPAPKTHTHNGTLLIALDALLTDQGYQITQTDTEIHYSQNNKRIVLSTQTPTARVSDTLQTIPYHTESPVLITANTVYMPLSVLHSVFDYSLEWQKKNQTLHILNPMQTPKIMPLSAPIQVSIDHSHTPEKPQITYAGNSVTLALNHSRFSRNGHDRYPKDYALKRVSWQSSSPRTDPPTSQLTLDFTKPHHVETRVVGRQLIVMAKPIVSAVHQRILYNNGAEIHIVTTGPVDRNYRISSSNSTLRIELPSTHLKPKTVESESHYYGTISIANTHIDIPLRSKNPLIFPEFGNQLTVRFQPDPDREIVEKITMPSPPLAPVNTKNEPLKRRVIAIDPGHGGSDPGAVGLYGMHEKDYNRDISDHLMRLLRQSGARVVNLRLSDRNPSLSSRSSEANANDADITVSVHVNSFYKEHANGTETYFYKWKDRRLATALQSAMTRELKLKDNGVKRSKLYILNHTTMPAALVEPAFMTNRDDAKKLKNPEFRARIAQSIHDGIVTYFESNP